MWVEGGCSSVSTEGLAELEDNAWLSFCGQEDSEAGAEIGGMVRRGGGGGVLETWVDGGGGREEAGGKGRERGTLCTVFGLQVDA